MSRIPLEDHTAPIIFVGLIQQYAGCDNKGVAVRAGTKGAYATRVAIADTCGICTSCSSHCAAVNDDVSYILSTVIAASNTCTATPSAATTFGCDIPSVYYDFFSRTI